MIKDLGAERSYLLELSRPDFLIVAQRVQVTNIPGLWFQKPTLNGIWDQRP